MSYDVALIDTTHSGQYVTVYTKNWTYNFSPALNATGLSLPDCDGKHAYDIAPEVGTALAQLKAHPDQYRPLIRGGGYDPNTGTYERLCEDLAELLEACTTHFAAVVDV